jgi:site-specific DNA-methyltransferase (cytosine-N4-specific)
MENAEMTLEPDKIYNHDATAFFEALGGDAVDLLVTSPPYGDVKRGASLMQSKGEYESISPDDYVKWFGPTARGIYKSLRSTGSFILNIDSQVTEGQINLYIYDLLLYLVRDVGFKFVQDYYWIKSVVLPSGRATSYKGPRRAVEQLWHFTKSDNYKVDTRNILMKYSRGMSDQLNNYARRQDAEDCVLPSGHSYKAKRMFTDHGGATPMNYIYAAPCVSNDECTQKWKELGLPIHPARFPPAIPEYFIRMLTDPGDLVCDCFMGSGTTAAVAKQLSRHYIGCDRSDVYCKAAEVRLALVKNVPSKKKSAITELGQFETQIINTT